MARKKWSVRVDPMSDRRVACTSEPDAYRRVREYADAYHASTLRWSRATVWVDEGRGWELFETVNLADLPPSNEKGS